MCFLLPSSWCEQTARCICSWTEQRTTAPLHLPPLLVSHALLRHILGWAQTTAMDISKPRNRNRRPHLHPSVVVGQGDFLSQMCLLSGSTLYTSRGFSHQRVYWADEKTLLHFLTHWRMVQSGLSSRNCFRDNTVGQISALGCLLQCRLHGLGWPVFWEAACEAANPTGSLTQMCHLLLGRHPRIVEHVPAAVLGLMGVVESLQNPRIQALK